MKSAINLRMRMSAADRTRKRPRNEESTTFISPSSNHNLSFDRGYYPFVDLCIPIPHTRQGQCLPIMCSRNQQNSDEQSNGHKKQEGKPPLAHFSSTWGVEQSKFPWHYVRVGTAMLEISALVGVRSSAEVGPALPIGMGTSRLVILQGGSGFYHTFWSSSRPAHGARQYLQDWKAKAA